jgi:hypothetical protein
VSDFGDLRYDKDDQLWTGRIRLPEFAKFGDLVRPESDVPGDSLPLAVNDPTGTGPDARQGLAVRHLIEHESEVLRVVLAALFDSYQQYTASPLSGFWTWLGRRLGVKPIESPDGLAVAAYFMSIEIAYEHVAGMSFSLFHVSCGWEPEHGMMVVYHPDRPATWTTPEALELESDPT